jgi:glycylpeptide N-tetradecanoyltransferase
MASPDQTADQTADARLASDMANASLEPPTATPPTADDTGEGAGEPGAAPANSSSSSKKRKKSQTTTDVAKELSHPQLIQNNKPVSAQDIPALLKQLAGEAGGKKEGKAPEDYKFWNTQPVPKFKEPNLLQTTDGKEGDLAEGPILPAEVCKASVKPEPEKLVDGFEWCLIDLEDKTELQEFYDLLYNHYVEDTDGSFRFNYSTKFLSWALKPPGWRKDWHIGVRTKAAEGKKGKLVASITGIPVTLQVRTKQVNAVEINFLAIHRKLRNKRLAPVLIKEVTRRCYQNGIYQALYTAGTLLPTPVSTCRYFHRSLDWEHLYKTGFSHMPSGSTELRQKLKYKLETQPQTKGLRPMKPADIPAVKDLLTRYSQRFHLNQEFTEDEIAHYICSDTSKDVVWSYVVEQEGRITDFISYYLLEVSRQFYEPYHTMPRQLTHP